MMASKDRHTLTNANSVRIEALARKTEALTENWQRAREARLKEQLAVNTELKRRWLEFDHNQAQKVRVATSKTTSSRRSPQRGNPLKALIRAVEIPVNNALAYLVSVLGIYRLASHQTHGVTAK
jgi:hypothetical protein